MPQDCSTWYYSVVQVLCPWSVGGAPPEQHAEPSPSSDPGPAGLPQHQCRRLGGAQTAHGPCHERGNARARPGDEENLPKIKLAQKTGCTSGSL
eukprot:scaffold10540_cov116-Isochrysis_galbana.AAC.3